MGYYHIIIFYWIRWNSWDIVK